MVNLGTSAQEVCCDGAKPTAFFRTSPKSKVADLCKSMVVNVCLPGAPLTYFNEGGGGVGPRDFLGLTFWPKGIFLGL